MQRECGKRLLLCLPQKRITIAVYFRLRQKLMSTGFKVGLCVIKWIHIRLSVDICQQKSISPAVNCIRQMLRSPETFNRHCTQWYRVGGSSFKRQIHSESLQMPRTSKAAERKFVDEKEKHEMCVEETKIVSVEKKLACACCRQGATSPPVSESGRGVITAWHEVSTMSTVVPPTFFALQKIDSESPRVPMNVRAVFDNWWKLFLIPFSLWDVPKA